MIFKIAWLNIWRNKVRSFVVVTAIALGLWAGLFASAFVNGMMKDKVNQVIKMEMSHFQFHEKEFKDEYLPKLFIKGGNIIEQRINTLEKDNLIGTSGRVITMAMIGSANLNGSVKVNGIIPETEARITGINEKLVEGKYFEGIKRNPVYISKKIATKYKVALRSKVILTMQDIDGEIVSGAFRVVGIFNTKNGIYDEMNVFVKRTDLQKMLGIEEGDYHELAVLIKEHEQAEFMAEKYQKLYPDLEVKSWLDLGIGMRFMVESMGTYTVVLVGIILVALLFSIINTMLMAVLERVREIGMLMAIGMVRSKVFMMIMLETVMLTMVGAPLGLLLSYGSISYFGTHGLDLGAGAAVYEEFGYASVIYTYLGIKDYINVTIMVVFMSVIAAISPARRALKLNPVESIRKI